MKSVILLGAGGHARVLLDLLESIGISVIGVTDLTKMPGTQFNGTTVLGGDEVLKKYDPKTVRLVNAVGAVGDNRAREGIFLRMKSLGFSFETLIHPATIISKRASIQEGAQIMAGVVIQSGTRVGANAILNSGAIVDHDCVVEDHAHLAPRTVLSGGVHVGVGAHLGTGASVIQGVRIGAYSLVGAGAAVVRDVPEGARVLGVPARAPRA